MGELQYLFDCIRYYLCCKKRNVDNNYNLFNEAETGYSANC